MKKGFFIQLISLSVITLLWLCMASCHRHKNDKEDAFDEIEAVEYPISIIPTEITTNLTDNGKLYPVTEDFLRDFLILANRYEGTQVMAHCQFPTEWGVLMVEHISDGKELWLLQSESREWMYIVVTSGMGTQRVLDILPVAVNLAVQENDILETEIWTTKREDDGSFSVEKTYEWIKSVPDNATKQEFSDTPEMYKKENYVVEKYFLNDMGRFKYVEQEQIPDYQAIIFYYDKMNKPEAWDEYMPMLQSFCEEKGIYFDEIYSGFDNVTIRDYKMNNITTLDLSQYIAGCEAGMVMLKKDENPRNVSFGSEERMKIEIRRYFKLLNQ